MCERDARTCNVMLMNSRQFRGKRRSYRSRLRKGTGPTPTHKRSVSSLCSRQGRSCHLYVSTYSVDMLTTHDARTTARTHMSATKRALCQTARHTLGRGAVGTQSVNYLCDTCDDDGRRVVAACRHRHCHAPHVICKTNSSKFHYACLYTGLAFWMASGWVAIITTVPDTKLISDAFARISGRHPGERHRPHRSTSG